MSIIVSEKLLRSDKKDFLLCIQKLLKFIPKYILFLYRKTGIRTS